MGLKMSSVKCKTLDYLNNGLMKSLRQQFKFSRTDIVLKLYDLGCRTNHQSLGDYENGKVAPRIDLVIALAEVYEVDIGYFLSKRDAA